ncbi:fimbrial protein [Pseudomonas aeruginosa]
MRPAADQTVKLQSIAAARLNGVGTYAAVTPFNLVVAGCPRGYNRVGYSLQAVGGAVAEGSGVLPRLAGSTATGVSIRVTDEAGVPLRMGLSLPVTAYDKNTGGAYWIPMKASYVQTAEKITPGSVLAAMVILLDYQ